MNYVTILNFSGRNEGNCAAVAKYISKHCQNTNICTIYVGAEIKPCSSCDYECLKPGQQCPELAKIKPVMDRIMESDMVYYIVPNFCGFPCSNYFAFNERTVGYFQLDRGLMGRYKDIKKKFIIISNTEDITFSKAMQQQSKDPQILYLKSSQYGKRSIAGDILDSDDAKRDLNAFLDK